ncbi:hypothetical protein O8C79_07030 [Aliarcobacter butzleri]|uniref:hypothetical protein n=1 Tax=Aliarcobacter butzleri TaxID=28197 RepID=UPI00263C22D0|nr:hypothetical protein [Aliarcobacter butzleri]MDN5105038.1 hypothetical protein [Aliarcobacter butzleri]
MNKNLIKIFISSANNFIFDGAELTQTRENLAKAIQKIRIADKKLFEVVINEKEINGMNESIWQTCVKWAEECDLFIFIDNGSSGSEIGATKMGILKAELTSAQNQNAKKIHGFSLKERIKKQSQRDIEYSEHINQYVLQKDIINYSDLEKRIILLINNYVLNVFHSGILYQTKQLVNNSTIEWKNMTYSNREKEIKKCLSDNFKLYMSKDLSIRYKYHAFPDSISIAESKEKVGQPFLYDYLDVEEMKKNDEIGPVHIIGCYGSITESQVKKILGFNDAIILKSSFGIYVADRVSQIQMIFIEKCQNKDIVKKNIASFFDWLSIDIKQEKMDEKIKFRAKKRFKIVQTMYENLE